MTTDTTTTAPVSGIPQQHYFSAADVARIAGVHISTVRRKARLGTFPKPHKVLGVPRWHIADLRAAGVELTVSTAA